jgi:hypothetical protein
MPGNGKRKCKAPAIEEIGPSVAFRSWSVPDFTRLSMIYGAHNVEENRNNGNLAYQQLLDRLSQVGNDECYQISLTALNYSLYYFLYLITMNTFVSQMAASERLKRQQRDLYKFEVMMGWLLRLVNGRCWVLPLVFLSIWAWKSRVPKPFWLFLRKIKLLYSKETTEMILTDLGIRVSLEQSFNNVNSKYSSKVILAVFDNCLVKFKTSYEGIRDDGDGSRPYLFINWLTAPVLEVDVPAAYDPDAVNGM